MMFDPTSHVCKLKYYLDMHHSYSTSQEATTKRTKPASTTIGANNMDKHKGKKVKASVTTSSRVPWHCALCEVSGHLRNLCPELEKLKALLHAPKILAAPPPHLGEKTTPTHNKALGTDHTCVICTNYGHYTHKCLEIPHYWDALGALAQANIVTSSPLVPPMARMGQKPFILYLRKKQCTLLIFVPIVILPLTHD